MAKKNKKIIEDDGVPHGASEETQATDLPVEADEQEEVKEISEQPAPIEETLADAPTHGLKSMQVFEPMTGLFRTVWSKE